MAAALRRTKIVATIGPSSSSHATVRALAEAGMDAARLNLSHGTHEDHAASAALVRRVQAAADVRDLQSFIRERGSTARVIAKIEKAEAVDALDEVLAESDGLMVARGDLGVEIGGATVPLIQKQIILRCLEVGKPVITA